MIGDRFVPDSNSASPRALRCAVADDDEAFRELVGRMLSRMGMEVETFADGHELLARCATEPPDLLLIDWMMPGIDGLEVVRRLREVHDSHRTFVIVVTGKDTEEDVYEAMEAGAHDYLTKPFDKLHLSHRVVLASRTIGEWRRLREAESARQRSLEDLLHVMDHAPDGMVVIREGRILVANPAFAAMVGREPHQLVDRPFVDLVHSWSTDQIDPTLEEQPQGSFTIQLINATGHIVEGECKAGETVDLRQGRGMLYAIRDVTERKQLEGRLAVADRLASVGTLASGVAHEINNPLGYLMSNLDFLLEHCAPQLNAGDASETATALREALEGAQRIREIVADLNRFSQLDLSAASDVGALVAGVLQMLQMELRERTRIELSIDSELPAAAIDDARLGQVFINLIVNAIQAMKSGRREENLLRISIRHIDDRLRVQLRDTGEGIAPDVLHRVFDPFFTTRSVGTGAGLGLTVCHSVLTEVGGEINIESMPREGTLVTFFLPTASSGQRTHRPMRRRSLPPLAADRRARILVIDDEILVGRSMRRGLSEHRVEIATTGDEALSLLEAEEFDLVLCDLMMPDRSGIDIYAAVREARPDLARRFVFVTGGTFSERARTFLAEIENPVYEKPFDLSRVQQLLESMASPQR